MKNVMIAAIAVLVLVGCKKDIEEEPKTAQEIFVESLIGTNWIEVSKGDYNVETKRTTDEEESAGFEFNFQGEAGKVRVKEGADDDSKLFTMEGVQLISSTRTYEIAKRGNQLQVTTIGFAEGNLFGEEHNFGFRKRRFFDEVK